MYYEAIKAAFGSFPLDPPRKLRVGDIVRISHGGSVTHYDSLDKLLGIDIATSTTRHEVEFLSSGATKAQVRGRSIDVAARIRLEGARGVYICGPRTVTTLQSVRDVVAALHEEIKTNGLEWRLSYRVVIETQAVSSAEIVCSGSSIADFVVQYGARGIGLSVSGVRGTKGLLHLPNVSGTIAFRPIRYVFGIPLGGAPAREYEYQEMDANDLNSYE